MDPLIIVSSDCHAGPPAEVYRSYLESRYVEDYDRWLKAQAASRASELFNADNKSGIKVDIHGKSIREAFENSEAVKAGGVKGAWDPAIRARELDREGIAAEVIFPDGTNHNDYPFNGKIKGFGEVSPELQLAGERAHNRWLAEFCTYQPERHAGVAAIGTADVAAAVAEITWAKKAGLNGGIVLTGIGLLENHPESFWHHPRYEPIWAACADMDMPVNVHQSRSVASYGPDSPGSRWINSAEIYWLSQRPTWFMIWGGILQRHPNLKFVNTEAGGSWVPSILQVLDYLWDVRNPEVAHEFLPLKPSEYWRRQCYIGASQPAGRPEIDLRHRIGVGNIMWGSDYPHLAGFWPRSVEMMGELFAGVPEADARLILGETAIQVYGLDSAKLARIAERISPTLEVLA